MLCHVRFSSAWVLFVIVVCGFEKLWYIRLLCLEVLDILYFSLYPALDIAQSGRCMEIFLESSLCAKVENRGLGREIKYLTTNIL